VHSFIESDLFDNNVPFDNTTPIYLINLLWKLGLGLGLDLRVGLFLHFLRRITNTSTLSFANFTEGNILLKEHTQTMNNKIKLHILGVPMNKSGNWLITRDNFPRKLFRGCLSLFASVCAQCLQPQIYK